MEAGLSWVEGSDVDVDGSDVYGTGASGMSCVYVAISL